MNQAPDLERTKSGYAFDIRFQDLIIWAPAKNGLGNKSEKKAIIKGISSSLNAGTMTAIIGPSGSGKTTLMNFLAGRQDNSQNFLTYCDYYINNTKIDSINEFKNIMGYVLQDDIMETRMTPRQLFEYYAVFRGRKDSKEKAQFVIDEMSLQKSADTVVGGIYKRGISGGEKKRTSIGIELVSDPNLLFLDEPTTGLDSTTAFDIIQNVAKLKELGMTIITTIHQPSEEIMSMFDKVLILCEGNIIYDESPKGIPEYLERFGFELPQFETPIEYFMKILDKNDVKLTLTKEGKDASDEEVNNVHQERIQKFIIASKEKQLNLKRENSNRRQSKIENIRAIANTKNQQINLFKQTEIFLRQNSKLFFTDFHGVMLKFLLFWITNIILLLIFLKMPNPDEDPQNAIQNRAGFYFMFLISQFFSAVSAMTTLFLPQKQIYLKDHQSRLYSRVSFFWGNALYIYPFYVVNVTAAIAMFFYALDLNNDPSSNFAWVWAFMVVGAWMGGAALGLFSATLIRNVEDMGAVNPILALPLIVCAGFFASIKTITWPLFIYSFLSVPRFTFQGVSLVEFQNSQVYLQHCVISEPCAGDPNTTCKVPVSNAVGTVCDPSTRFDFYETDVWLNFLVVIILVLGWSLIAFLTFCYKYSESSTKYGFDQEFYDLYCGNNRAQADVVEGESSSINLNRNYINGFNEHGENVPTV